MRLKEKEKLEKKEIIINVARKLFSQYGFEPVTISEIAKRAGVAKGTIYTYFENKYELFIEVLKFAEDITIKKVDDFLKKNKDATSFEKIFSILNIFKDFIKTYPEYISIFMILNNQLPQEVREKIIKTMEEMDCKKKHVWNIIAQIIEEGKERGEVNKNVNSVRGGIKIWFFHVARVIMLSILNSQFFVNVIDDYNKKDIEAIILEFLTSQIKKVLEG